MWGSGAGRLRCSKEAPRGRRMLCSWHGAGRTSGPSEHRGGGGAKRRGGHVKGKFGWPWRSVGAAARTVHRRSCGGGHTLRACARQACQGANQTRLSAMCARAQSAQHGDVAGSGVACRARVYRWHVGSQGAQLGDSRIKVGWGGPSRLWVVSHQGPGQVRPAARVSRGPTSFGSVMCHGQKGLFGPRVPLVRPVCKALYNR